MKNQLISWLIAFSTVFVGSSAGAFSLNIWGYKDYTVKKIRPFFTAHIIILEHDGEKKWYYMTNEGIDSCNLYVGKEIEMQLVQDDPLNGISMESLRNSDVPAHRALYHLKDNPLAKGITKRVVKHVKGCNYDFVD